jgi:Ca2+-binding RTX toxin-like protein
MITPILGPELHINTINNGVEKSIQLEALANGRFLALWQGTTVNELGKAITAIFAQPYYSGGVPEGNPIQINTTLEGTHSDPMVTSLSDGRLVYIWQHYRLERIVDETTKAETFVDHYEIRARIFKLDGTPYDRNGASPDGTEDFMIASSTTHPQTAPKVAALPNNGFVVTYADGLEAAGAGSGIKAAVYKADAQPLGEALSVTDGRASDQANSSIIALKSGEFVALYKDLSTDPDSLEESVHIRVFSTSGTTPEAVDAEDIRLQVKKGTVPVAASLKDGKFIVVWTALNGDDDGTAVLAQIYNANGSESGHTIVVNQAAARDQDTPAVTSLVNGGFAISYLDYSETRVPHVKVAVFDSKSTRMINDKIVDDPDLQFAKGERTHPSIIEMDDGRLIVAWDESIPGRTSDTDGIRGRIMDARFTPIKLPGTAGHDQYVGTGFDDTLSGGTAGRDHLNGLAGNDSLDGGIDDDTIDGGLGADTMIGGSGDDRFYVDDVGDVVVELMGGGIDTILVSTDFTLTGEIENLTATGVAPVRLTGSAIANTIIGNSSDNVIDGGLGADVMRGDAGNDTYYVDNAGDVIIDGAGIDTVFTSVDHILSNDAEVLTASGSAGIALTGNAFNNTITGNGGKNKIDGGAGNDAVNGGSGNDIVSGGAGNDALTGGAGKDMFVFKDAIGTYKTNKKLNLDTVKDYKTKDDSIWLDNAIFKKLGKKGSEKKPAKLYKDFFTVGSKAEDKKDYLIYDKKKGILYYDADGSDKGKQIEIAKFDKKPALSLNEFFVI